MSDSLAPKNNSPCSDDVDNARRLRKNFNATLAQQYLEIACHLRLVLELQKSVHQPVDLAAFLAPDLTRSALSIVRQVTEEASANHVVVDKWWWNDCVNSKDVHQEASLPVTIDSSFRDSLDTSEQTFLKLWPEVQEAFEALIDELHYHPDLRGPASQYIQTACEKKLAASIRHWPVAALQEVLRDPVQRQRVLSLASTEATEAPFQRGGAPDHSALYIARSQRSETHSQGSVPPGRSATLYILRAAFRRRRTLKPSDAVQSIIDDGILRMAPSTSEAAESMTGAESRTAGGLSAPSVADVLSKPFTDLVDFEVAYL